MDWKDVAGKIASNAPQLGALLGSVVPGVGNIAGGAAGLGIKALASAFGLSPDAKPEEIAAAIDADPQAGLKLRIAEMDYNVRMKELENERYRDENKRLEDQNDNYRKELDTRTIPWVDALHKMGRQISNWLTFGIVGLGMALGHVFTPQEVVLLTGGNAIYQFVKGKGRPTEAK